MKKTVKAALLNQINSNQLTSNQMKSNHIKWKSNESYVVDEWLPKTIWSWFNFDAEVGQHNKLTYTSIDGEHPDQPNTKAKIKDKQLTLNARLIVPRLLFLQL